jgi:glycosyltransferase involved in cell wall biosynthesis
MLWGLFAHRNYSPRQREIQRTYQRGFFYSRYQGATADAILTYLDNPQLADEIGLRNRHYLLENYDWTKTVKGTPYLFRQLLEDK